MSQHETIIHLRARPRHSGGGDDGDVIGAYFEVATKTPSQSAPGGSASKASSRSA